MKIIAFMLRLRNKVINIYSHYTYLSIEIVIHLLQPYPYITTNWTINTLGLNVSYSVNSILASMTILRLYVCFRVFKNFNMYNVSDIKSLSQFDLNSVYRFLYRCNMRYRPFSTLMVIFVFFYYFCTIVFVIYERYGLVGEFNFTWNVFWLIVVTITTSK